MRISDWSSDVCSSDLELVVACPERLPCRQSKGAVLSLRCRKEKNGASTGSAQTEDGRSAVDEFEKVGVEAVLLGDGEAVAAAFIDLEHRLLDDLDRRERRGADRHDLVVDAVKDEGRLVELFAVLVAVAFRKRADAVEQALETAVHALPHEFVAPRFRNHRAVTAIAERQIVV